MSQWFTTKIYEGRKQYSWFKRLVAKHKKSIADGVRAVHHNNTIPFSDDESDLRNYQHVHYGLSGHIDLLGDLQKADIKPKHIEDLDEELENDKKRGKK